MEKYLNVPCPPYLLVLNNIHREKESIHVTIKRDQKIKSSSCSPKYYIIKLKATVYLINDKL